MVSNKDARDEERANKKQFYISKNSQRLGPFSKRDIQAKLDDGSVAPIDWIWRGPMTEWQPVYALINSREVEDILKHAVSIKPENDQDITAWNERAGELAVAIKKANGLCPWAHIQLSHCLRTMGFYDRAKQELKTALAQDQYSVGARYLMLFHAIDELGLPRNLPSDSGSFVVDITVLAFGGLAASNKLAKFSQMIDELIAAVPHNLGRTDDVDSWLNVSEKMLKLHDTVQSIKALSGKDRFARAVLGLPWKNLAPTPEEQNEINEVIHKAERRLALAA